MKKYIVVVEKWYYVDAESKDAAECEVAYGKVKSDRTLTNVWDIELREKNG